MVAHITIPSDFWLQDSDADLSIHDQLFCHELNNLAEVSDQLQLIVKNALLHTQWHLRFCLLKLMCYSSKPFVLCAAALFIINGSLKLYFIFICFFLP